MPVDPVALARRVVAHPGWKWTAGILVRDSEGGVRLMASVLAAVRAEGMAWDPDVLPDLTDPVTLAWICGPWLEGLGACIVPTYRLDHRWVYEAYVNGKRPHPMSFTRLEALADALDLLEVPNATDD